MARCPHCGNKISFWTDRSGSICNKCRDRLKAERKAKTQKLVAQFSEVDYLSRYSCPSCEGTDIVTARRKNAITFTSSLSYALRRCRDCNHEWLLPRNRLYLGFLLVVIICLMIVYVILGTFFVTTVVAAFFNPAPGAAPPRSLRGVVIVAIIAIAIGAGLVSALTHCITAMRISSRVID